MGGRVETNVLKTRELVIDLIWLFLRGGANVLNTRILVI